MASSPRTPSMRATTTATPGVRVVIIPVDEIVATAEFPSIDQVVAPWPVVASPAASSGIAVACVALPMRT